MFILCYNHLGPPSDAKTTVSDNFTLRKLERDSDTQSTEDNLITTFGSLEAETDSSPISQGSPGLRKRRPVPAVPVSVGRHAEAKLVPVSNSASLLVITPNKMRQQILRRWSLN